MSNAPTSTTPVSRRRRWLWLLLSAAVIIAATMVVRFGISNKEAIAEGNRDANLFPSQRPGNGSANVATKKTASTVAMVDGQPITRDELAAECLKYHGRDVLSNVTNKFLIVQHCQQRGIEIKQQDLDQEIQATARRFGVPADQWLSMLEAERGISPEHYANDIVWPTIALRRLAADQLEVTEEEIAREIESQFGPTVQIRLISVGNRGIADKVRALAAAAPQDFAKLAGQYSNDVDSASAGGLIPPVHRYAGDAQLERIAFGLQDGDVSDVIPVNNQFMIIKCEKHVAGDPRFGNNPPEVVRKKMIEVVKDRKLRNAGTDLFKQLARQAEVRNIMGDPAASQRMPGVAATVNGQPITIAQLADDCVARHGREVLHRMIMRTIVANALKRQQQTISDAEMDAEIARAAKAAGVVTKDGQPDVARWTDIFTRQQQVSAVAYRNDIVWPTVALKKLVAAKVKVTDGDMAKGFEASYGPRVRCRAIVLDNHRRAQQVWDMARRDSSLENFGRLATEYSVEPSSRALEGQVPPIQMHGNQPALEKEAFALKTGEISGVIQVADKFVILFCEGRTKPVIVDQQEVAPILQEDLMERKMRVAMADEFDRLQDAADVENVLDPKASHRPAPKTDKAAGQVPGIATRPAPSNLDGGSIRR